MFTQQSVEYIEQIESEIERLQQLRDQVRATIHSEEELEGEAGMQPVPRKRAAKKKTAGKKSAAKKVASKKRGRSSSVAASE